MLVQERERIEIAEVTDLRSLAERANASGVRYILTENGQPIAELRPAKARPRRRHQRAKMDVEALLATAGGWADIDVDRFLADNYAQRDASIRPAVEL